MSAEDHLPPGEWEPDDECIHGLGRKADCVICNGTMRTRDREEPERTFRSKYPGHCPDCNLPIHIGQMISWRPGGPARHAECTGE